MATHLSNRPRYSKRLMLRPFHRRDVGSLDRSIRESLPDLETWLPWAVGYDRGVAQRFVRESVAAWSEGKAFDFAIRLLDDPDRHIGNVSVWHVSQQNRVGEIGYWVHSDFANAGIATEATARTLQIGFEELNLHKVTLRIAVGNDRSERVAEKLGFLKEGTLRDEVRVGAEWIDHTIWSLLDSEWIAQKDRLEAEGRS
jgi:ribosomal-protein-serine acetyltransferase